MAKYGSWVGSVLLLLATALLYGQFLNNPVMFDDKHFLSALLSPNNEFAEFAPWRVRWLPYWTLAIGAAGLEDYVLLPLRLVSLILHAGVGIALFFFLKRLFRLVLRQGEGKFHPDWMAFFAALFFVLHPVAVYGAGYLVQRTIVMATLFGLLSLLAYLRGLESQKPRWFWTSVAFYFMAVMSKEHVIMLPAVMLALTVLLSDAPYSLMRRWWAIYAACLAIAVFVVSQKIGLLGTIYEPLGEQALGGGPATAGNPHLMSALTQSWLFFKYMGLWLFPNPAWMSVDMREPFAQSFWPFYLPAFCAFVAWGVGAFLLLRRRGRLGLVGLSMLFPWLLFMTEFSTVRVQESFVLYRSYAWAVGACAVLPLLLDWLDKRVAMTIVVTVVLAMFPVSMERLSTFSHPLLLWDDAEKLVAGRSDLPFTARIYNNRGLAWLDLMLYDKAIKDFERAIELTPDIPQVHNNLGAAYLKKGEWRAAIASFDRAISLMKVPGSQQDGRPFLGRARAYENLGDMVNARLDYQESCRISRKGCDKL